MTDAGIPMGEVLKPCPFCGGEAETCFNIAIGHAPMFWFLCRKCHASPGDRQTQPEAIAAWNTRAFADTPPPAAAGDREVEARDWDTVIAELYQWTGSDWLSGSGAGHEDHRFEHYHWLCGLAGYLMAGKEACLKALRTPDPNSGGGVEPALPISLPLDSGPLHPNRAEPHDKD